MPPRLPSDLLDRSAQEASRLLALSYLDQVDQARARLGDSLDRDALHDFRVGVRRLRSAIRAYRPELDGSVGGKMRRQLRRLARATNDGRDLEVQLAWLEKQPERLGLDDLRGFFWLVGRLEDRKEKTRDRAIAGVARQYEKVTDKLRKTLGILRIELQSGQGQRVASFRQVTGGLVRRQVTQLGDDLGRIRDASDAEQVHRTRISLKRLRYLVEPVARRNRRAGALIQRFKEAQDLLGEHHDMHVLSATVAALRTGVSTGTFSGLEPGLATVGRLADESARMAFERFQSVWGGELGGRILARAEQLGSALQEPLEVESPGADHEPQVRLDQPASVEPATAGSEGLAGKAPALATSNS